MKQMVEDFMRGVWRMIVLFILGLIVLLFALAFVALYSKATGAELVIASTYSDGTRDSNAFIAAHKSLPLGTKLTLSHGHRVVVVTINDRGPFVRGRALDLTPAANKFLQCGGLCRVRVDHWPPLPRPKPDDTIAWGEE